MPGPGRHGGGTDRPKNAGKTFSRILSYMSGSWLLFALVIICILISAAGSVFGTSLMRSVIDDSIVPLITNYTPELWAGFIRTCVLMGAAFALSALSSYAYSRIMMEISAKALYKIRIDMFTKMESLPIKYFDTHDRGDIMSRYTNDADALREMLSSSVAQFISSGITVISVFVMMIIYSWQLTLLVVGMLVVMLLLIGKIGGKSSKYFKEQQQSLGHANAFIEEFIRGQKVVKVFCHEPEAKADFAAVNEELRVASTNANTFANILMPIMGNLSHILYALTAAVGGALALAGSITVGTVVAFLQYTRSFSQPISQIAQQFNSVLMALAGSERIFNLIDEEPEADDGYVTLVNAKKNADGSITESAEHTGLWAWKHPHSADGSVTYTELRGDVRFADVTFSYDGVTDVLHDVTLYAKPGQKIAFVGSTGAGKTTITNLINRFYDVPDGKIRYDGINIGKIKKADLRRSLGMVLQDTHLFTGTVMDNIRYGKLTATNEECIAAAKLANAHFFISHLPHGYDTVLTSDGANLSQGQRQLIAIARAAVADPPVLILDEATSSIDTRTEALIERGMDELMAGRTVFVIAHRLSTVRNSNAIMVLEHGRIIERGDHDELLAQKGKYYQLYTGALEIS